MAARLARDGYPHDCRQCAKSAEYRASHGCDCEAESVQARIECPECRNGAGAEECGHCDGTGFKEFFVCPRKIVDADTVRFMRAASLVEFGVLPSEGGTQDQSNAFNEALFYWFGVKNALDEEDRRRNEAKMKAERNQGHGGIRRRNR